VTVAMIESDDIDDAVLLDSFAADDGCCAHYIRTGPSARTS
jgi:hypothetical protein